MISFKFKNIFISGFLFLMFLAPLFSVIYAQTGSPAGTGIVTSCEGSGCNFDELMLAIKKVMDYGVKIALMFSVVIIAYAGWVYLNSGGNPGERSKANGMFVKVGWGILFVLSAWLIVNLIVDTLVEPKNITKLME
jgi:hypothetical protein